MEEIKTHILCSISFFFFFEHRAGYEITCQNLVEWGRPQMTIRALRIACCITKAIDTFTVTNTYCFSTVTMVVRMHCNVTIYVHCLSCVSVTLLR